MKKSSILLGCMLSQAASHAQSKQAVNLELNKEYSVQGFKFTEWHRTVFPVAGYTLAWFAFKCKMFIVIHLKQGRNESDSSTLKPLILNN